MVAEAVGPLSARGLVEAFHLPVGLWSVGLCASVLDLVLGEELAQRMIVGIAPGVVAHQSLGVDALKLEPVEGSRNEGGDGLCSLVAVQLNVGQPRVVIHDRVSEVIAHSSAGLHPVACAL